MAAAIVMLEMISRPSTSFNIECQKNLNFKILINFGFEAFHESDRIRARSDLDRQLEPWWHFRVPNFLPEKN